MVWVGLVTAGESNFNTLVATAPCGDETASSHCLGQNDDHIEGVCTVLAKKFKKLMLLSVDTNHVDLSQPQMRSAVIKSIRETSGPS